MFEQLPRPVADPILTTMAAFRADERANRIDLGVGVYRDASGITPIMRAVKAAELNVWRQQSSKTYVGIEGDPEFNASIVELVFGQELDRSRICAIQTPGGSGALRLVFELVQRANPELAVWTSDPTWPNHSAILASIGLIERRYAYFDATTKAVNLECMLRDLAAARPGDAVLLHACCHNPTGANLSVDEWCLLADILKNRRLVPVVDCAYQGFGDGLDEDVVGLRILASRLPETLVAVSCSKNFGLYRDRVGAALSISAAEHRASVFGSFLTSGRVNYSMPPDHGAAVVRTILRDEALRSEWTAELTSMRMRMARLRWRLAHALETHSGSDRFGFIGAHRGMFSRLGATPEQVRRLCDEYAIYLIGDGRMNIAGLPEERLDDVARALIAVGL